MAGGEPLPLRRVGAVIHRMEEFSMRRMLTLLVPLLALLAAAPLLAACNTMAGAGQDISNTGHALTNSADKAQ